MIFYNFNKKRVENFNDNLPTTFYTNNSVLFEALFLKVYAC